MTELVIRNARLLDPASGLDTTGDLLVQDGHIATVGDAGKPASGADEINAEGLCLAPGLIDLRVKTGEPGARHKETLKSASQSAVAGGVTSMVVMPDTDPVIDDEALVQFITRQGERGLNRIYPAGALTQGLDGKAMAELGLMRDAGAILFSNGEHSVANASVMKRAMAYAADLEAILMVRAEDADLIGSGIMNAGALAARMGLAGMSVEAEYVMGLRDLILAQNTGCRLILDQVSTVPLLNAVKTFQAEGADVHATIAAHHLFFNELDVGDYLTYCKVSPPFRDEDTRLALIDGVKSGVISAVVSAHDPQPPEEKRVPFADASFGAAGLETTLAAMLSLVHNEQLSLLEALAPLTSGPAGIANLPGGSLETGSPADLVLFDLDKPWVCDGGKLRSRSTNSPFDGRRLQGLVMQTIVGGKTIFARKEAGENTY